MATVIEPDVMDPETTAVEQLDVAETPSVLESEEGLVQGEVTATEAPKSDQELIIEGFLPERLRWKNLDPIVLTWIVGMHLGCLAAPFFFTWDALAVTVVLHWLTCSIGICLGYHRFLSHRSLKLAWPVKAFTLLAGTLSGEGSALTWAANHRLHHQKSDQRGDPHSPREGEWWSHILWLFVYRTPEHRALLYKKYVPDRVTDRTVVFFDRTYIFWLVGSAVALWAIGGWPWVVWGVCVRMTLAYHSTWFVNSATHLWGYRNYDDVRDDSRNLWWVALAAYGEGWHNNHHAHPHVARAGHKWWELDPTWWSIALLRKLGLAWDVDDRIPTGEPAQN